MIQFHMERNVCEWRNEATDDVKDKQTCEAPSGVYASPAFALLNSTGEAPTDYDSGRRKQKLQIKK